MSDSGVPSYIGRAFDQICFVVEDLDAATDYWKKVNGVDNWLLAIDLAKEQTEKEYWGRESDFQFSCAYGFSGNVLIELARHDGGESLYRDWMDERGRGPHHIGFLLEDPDEYARAKESYEASGLVQAMTGFLDGPTICRWSYWDTRESIGCYTELYYVAGEGTDQMKRLRAGETVELAG